MDTKKKRKKTLSRPYEVSFQQRLPKPLKRGSSEVFSSLFPHGHIHTKNIPTIYQQY